MVRIKSTGAVCAVGIGVMQVSAAVRAGISRSKETSLLVGGERLVSSWLPDEALPELPADVQGSPLTYRQMRMMRLALPAILEALGDQQGPVPLFLGLPDNHPGVLPPPVDAQQWVSGLIHSLPTDTIDSAASMVFPLGRASAMVALQAAIEYLKAAAKNAAVLVGGVDTFWDMPLLTRLAQEQRLLLEGVMDGFIPGEGAAFLLLTNSPASEDELFTHVVSTGVAMEVGHRYSQEPLRGDGLSEAIEQLRTNLPASEPANLVYAGYNGESFDAKPWGTTSIRHKELFATDHMFEHPADVFGDLGAGLGAMLMVLANIALLAGYREGPALIWAGSDLGTTACVWITMRA